jgi:hypothetical protein
MHVHSSFCLGRVVGPPLQWLSNCTPSTYPLATEISNNEPALPEPLSPEEQLARIDAILNQTLSASLAYNAPSRMQIHETVMVELLLNPSLSEETLKEEISEPGQSKCKREITPDEAELLSG